MPTLTEEDWEERWDANVVVDVRGGGGGNEGRVRRMRRVGAVVDVENQEGYLECRGAAACGPLGDQVPPIALIGSTRPYLDRSREAVLFHTGLRSLTRYSSTLTRKHSKYTTLVLVHHVNYYDGDSGDKTVYTRTDVRWAIYGRSGTNAPTQH